MAGVQSVLTVLNKYVPEYLAKFVEWYMTPEDKREPWENLATYNVNFKHKNTGKMKSIQFAEENWLPRADVQKAMQAYLKFFKTQNMTMLYKTMLDKAMNGDIKAADWVVKFSESSFFDDSDDEIDMFLSDINIPALKGKGE